MKTRFISFIFVCITLIASCFIINNKGIYDVAYAQNNTNIFGTGDNKLNSGHEGLPYLGVNMRGYHTSLPQVREDLKDPFPSNYYESSFKTLSKTDVIDHVRYRFYWESYVRDPVAFIKELEEVARTADKYGIKVIYDNHQFHTSSWLNIERGTGFPAYLFNDPVLYKQGSGGTPKSTAAETWWTNWWNRTIKSVNGTDGWTLQEDFLKKIVSTVDKHQSTLGIRNSERTTSSH